MQRGAGPRICLAQLGSQVGDLDGNRARILAAAAAAGDADLLLTPEFGICGYPPEDLIAYPDFLAACASSLEELAAQLARQAKPGLHVVVGLPWREGAHNLNRAVVLNDGKVVAHHDKIFLPNHGVFDEKRHFRPGERIGCFELKGAKVALAICHDIWIDAFATRLEEEGADVLAVINASPFYLGVQEDRERHTLRLSEICPTVAYVNLVGAQDEHVYDGGSHVASAGKLVQRLADFEPEVAACSAAAGVAARLAEIEQVERALVVAVKAYCERARAAHVFVGVSGGIDSAVVLCVAAAALGASNVTAVLLPSQITSAMSCEDARELASNLGVACKEIPIKDAVACHLGLLAKTLGRDPAAVAVENLQSRIRGTLLMALANDAGGLVLTTGNKSEMATGYATLYGDMAGAFDVLKDLSKTRVYQLARHYNRATEVIPRRIIERPPTAELAEGQLDSDSLPDYELLDGILEDVVERLASPQKLAATGKAGAEVYRFVELLERSEFKRRQAPIGPNITRRAFGKSWRMPVSNEFSFLPPDGAR